MQHTGSGSLYTHSFLNGSRSLICDNTVSSRSTVRGGPLCPAQRATLKRPRGAGVPRHCALQCACESYSAVHVLAPIAGTAIKRSRAGLLRYCVAYPKSGTDRGLAKRRCHSGHATQRMYVCLHTNVQAYSEKGDSSAAVVALGMVWILTC